MVGPEALAVVKGGKNVLGPAAVGAGVAGAAALKPVVSIKENTVGVRTRFGTAVKRGKVARALKREGDFHGILRADNGILGTGTHFKLSHSVKRLSLAHRTNDLKPIEVDTAESEQVRIDSSIIWAISGAEDEHPYRALTKIEASNAQELAEIVMSVCVGGIRTVTKGQPRAYIEDEAQVFEDLVDCRQPELLGEYGVHLVQLNIDTVTATPPQIIAHALRHGGMPMVQGVPELFVPPNGRH